MDDRLKIYVVIAAGVAAMLYAIALWGRLRRCNAWPSTEGIVIKSDKTIRRHNFQKVEKVTVRYSYFAGRNYESETVKVGGFMHLRKQDQDALIVRYPLGAKVQVFYDPYRPKVACLEKRGLDSVLIIAGYGCFALTIGLLLYFFA